MHPFDFILAIDTPANSKFALYKKEYTEVKFAFVDARSIVDSSIIDSQKKCLNTKEHLRMRPKHTEETTNFGSVMIE